MTTQNRDQFLRLRGFRIEIRGAGGSGTDSDSAWETCTGGSPYKFVEEITLRGPITAGRKSLVQFINEAAAGKAHRFDLTIVEIGKDGSDGKRYTCHDSFPTRYVFPALSADGTGNLYEDVHIKPERLTLQ
ncbi:MAG: hypothetical protein FJ312_09700 [SAR202 cluster bacterium]|nr:hypothetical protein [SAR202 cluster bacterium]